MSVIYGTVVDVAIDTDVKYAPPKSGSYKGFRLTYRAEDGTIKDVAKSMTSLKYSPNVKQVLSELVPGDQFTLVQEKNDAGFLDIKSLSKGHTAAGELPPEAFQKKRVENASSARQGSTGGSGREGDDRSKSIIRQAVLKAAAEFTAVQKGATAETVLENAEKFENWVNR